MRDVIIRGPENIYIGEAATLSIQGINAENIRSFDWSFDEVALVQVSKRETALRIEPLLSGIYTIEYEAVIRQGDNIVEYYGKEQFKVETKEKSNSSPALTEDSQEEESPLDPYREIILSNKRYDYSGLPHFMKRNARYRGHRESEKVLNSDQEQTLDFRHNYKDILYTQKMIDTSSEMWFGGRIGENVTKRTIKEEKVYQATPENNLYLLNNTDNVSRFENIVVKLNEDIVDSQWYEIAGNYLFIDISDIDITMESGTLYISFDSIVLLHNDDSEGLYPIMNRLKHLDEKIEEMNRRYMRHENAYK